MFLPFLLLFCVMVGQLFGCLFLLSCLFAIILPFSAGLCNDKSIMAFASALTAEHSIFSLLLPIPQVF